MGGGTALVSQAAEASCQALESFTPSVWLSRKANPSFRTYWGPKSAVGNNKGKVIERYQNLGFPMGIVPGNV